MHLCKEAVPDEQKFILQEVSGCTALPVLLSIALGLSGNTGDHQELQGDLRRWQ
jgi:hypothetical protein